MWTDRKKKKQKPVAKRLRKFNHNHSRKGKQIISRFSGTRDSGNCIPSRCFSKLSGIYAYECLWPTLKVGQSSLKVAVTFERNLFDENFFNFWNSHSFQGQIMLLEIWQDLRVLITAMIILHNRTLFGSCLKFQPTAKKHTPLFNDKGSLTLGIGTSDQNSINEWRTSN